ncbi:MAG: hypothetical protein V2A73_16050 [Pseudomonadota bacterium]
MAIETRERDIDGHHWSVTMLPASRGMEIARKLLRLAGPALGKAMTAIGGSSASSGGGSLLDAELPVLGDAVAALAAGLGEPESTALIKELATTGVFCDGVEVKPVQFEVLFAGQYATLIKLVGFVLETNFSLPFDSWANAAKGLAVRVAQSPSLRPKPSVKSVVDD